MSLVLLQVPVWRDNYAYLLAQGTDAVLVDSPEAGPIEAALADRGWTLRAILNTHHHGDHVGSNEDLVAHTGCRVYGPAHDRDRIPGLTHPATVGATVEVIGLSFRVLDVHAHTRGHICYALDTPVDEVWRWGHDGTATRVARLEQRPLLFVGDSLFLGGCGRLFEGDAADLTAVMATYRAESPEALVCCAHEYTGSNFRFAESVSAGVPAVGERRAQLDEERAASGSSVPDTLGRELSTNPFLLAFEDGPRAHYASALGCAPEVTTVLGALREAKDNF